MLDDRPADDDQDEMAGGAMWVFTRDPNELWGAGAAVAGFCALWGGGLLLGRFSAERDGSDPERWLLRQRRAK